MRSRAARSASGAARAAGSAKRSARDAARVLSLPRPVRVRVGGDGAPREVDGQPIESLRESWLVEDRWWSEAPLRRRYWEVVSARGANIVVFRDLRSGGWYRQPA
jgi:hypothetical protein